MFAAVQIEDLSKSFGKIKALKQVSMDVPAGAIYGLLGSNGAGKTTLIKALVGALKTDSGNVKVLGLDPVKDKWELRKRIGYMPQWPALYEDISARSNILFFGSAQKVEDLEKKTDELLSFTQLSERGDDLLRTFSGGMKKRVSLCCALVHSPEIVFLDEPTAAIDPALKHQSWILFRKLANSGVTLFISTHLMDEALLCDKITVLRDGEILLMDTPRNILEKGITKLNISANGNNSEISIESTPESLADILHQYGLDKNISSLSIQSQNIEDILLGLIHSKENTAGK